MPRPKPPARPGRASGARNLQKAWQASREHWQFTPARQAVSRRTIQRALAANRRRPRKLSPLQLAAVRRNLARARAALNARGRSPEHLEKLRQTTVKARAARTARSDLLYAEKVLKHGLFARRLSGPLACLGEDGRTQAALERRVVRYLDPQSPAEEKVARQVARALASHHRLYFAQAVWEQERLKKFLLSAPPAEHSWRLLSRLEGLLRRFIARRAAGKPGFRMGERVVVPPPSGRVDRELEDLITDPELRIDMLEAKLAMP